ncbi:MotA/TolQ/ExbB proton channel family protein [Solimonas sp. SE-A11]|jgi:biopolymer transport protein ExbB|uniref:MotA/TolQ/ExbB proton channel family protein n=1 Tax=Solimonas sp. SE-A11 TaxID=3054954 RepID=UPI00259D29AA|nr:MotA/TolQ/ExbB proton channel family protein [Solimonas sp. SE-A11]MDM4768823.1 MotA/TolQ/ExbB proton channel family protein [Solimonas sp. SE-A11]
MDFFAKVLHFFQEGGLFMYPIALVAVCAIAIAVERWFFLRRVQKENAVLWAEVSPLIAQGDLETAARVTEGSDTAIARIISNGIAQARVENKRSEIEVAAEEGLMEVLPAIEKRTHYLGTFSNMSTLLGLLGTVIGLIGSFAALGAADPAEKADLLSKGISEAMNCTAFGLMVAIPSLLLHSYLQSRTTELVDGLEAVAGKFVNALSSRRR